MIPTRVHGLADYGAAAGLGALSQSAVFSPRARSLLRGVGAYHLGYSALTDYEAGLAACFSMRQHLLLDTLGAGALCAAGLRRSGESRRARALLVAAGLAEFAVIALSDSKPASGPGQGSGWFARLSGRPERPTRRSDGASYPPLDVLKPVADDLWIVDSVIGRGAPVRMTVIRLPTGDLLLHSPTRFTDQLRWQLERIGRIRHLVAPNIAHWTFLPDWQRAVPDAVTWGAPRLRERAQVRRSGVRLDHDLTHASPPEWAADTEQAVIHGAAGFTEVALFHKPTRTLLLTDLVVNLEPAKVPVPLRPLAWLLGVLAPDGRAPAYLRALVKLGRSDKASAAARMLQWHPERVIFTHGRWFDRDGEAQLRRSWRWLLNQRQPRQV